MVILRTIDSISAWLGKYLGFLLFPLVGVLFIEVVLRYGFNRPTLWAHETAIFLFGTLGMFAGAYILLVREHVNFDVLYRRLSPRRKAIMDSATALLFFLVMGVIIWQGWKMAFNSTIMRECTCSVWQPPIYPFKWVIPGAGFLLLIQGIANFTRDIFFAISGRKLS